MSGAFLLILPLCFSLSFAFIDNYGLQQGERFRRMCRPPSSCSFLISALRDPRHISAWRIDSWKRAIDQLLAYKQLFSEDVTPSVKARTKRSTLTSNSGPLFQWNLNGNLKGCSVVLP